MFFHRFRPGRKGPFLNKFVTFVATGGYAGFFPVAPGTVGALVGLLLFYLFSNFSLAIYLLSTTALFFLGAWAAEKAEISFGRKDCPKIVIDEVVGYLVTMVLIPFTYGNAFGGFLFFRLFDIIKAASGQENRPSNAGRFCRDSGRRRGRSLCKPFHAPASLGEPAVLSGFGQVDPLFPIERKGIEYRTHYDRKRIGFRGGRRCQCLFHGQRPY